MKKHFTYIFKPFTSVRILYSQYFVYIFKVLRLYIQSIASIYSKRFEYKIDTDNQRYTCMLTVLVDYYLSYL